MDKKVKVRKIKKTAKLPMYGTECAAGADLYACMEKSTAIEPGETVFIHTGIIMEIPKGYVGLVFGRSGLACKKGIAPANKVGVIDSDYRGEIMVALYNHSRETVLIEPEERIAQIVITPYLTAEFTEEEELMETKRGTGGFGSTGKK